MAHKFKCGGCGRDVVVKWLAPGDTARCRACGAEMPVPAGAEQVPDDTPPGPSPEARPAPSPAAGPGCPACRFLQKSPSFFDNGIGYCRRFPPHPRHRCPEVTAADWCGEYSPAE